MNQVRLHNMLDAMSRQGIRQMVISDPVSIDYLTGIRLYPGERLLALVLRLNGCHRLLLNDLFPLPADPGVDVVRYSDDENGVAVLAKCLHPRATTAVDKNWPARFLLELQSLYPFSRFVSGSSVVDAVRMIKNEDEQEAMIASSAGNDRVMERLIGILSEGHDELELNAIVRGFYAEEGFEGVSFDPITAFGANGADPHHGPDHSKGKAGDSVVLDIGGMMHGYASDMTRTVFLGSVSERQREVYEIVREAQRRGIEAAVPGNRMCDVDLACRNYIESKGFGAYFTHRTGHSIGLEDHEVGDVSSTNTEPIRPGQCFSVEPGIYLPEEGFGVRIEDLVLITEDGHRVLNSYPKELTVVPFPAK